VRLDKHVNNIGVLKLAGKVEYIIVLGICIHDVDSVLSKHLHHCAVSVAACDPKGVETLLILLLNFNHLVFKHESDKILVALSGCNFKRESILALEIDVVISHSTQIHEVVQVG
jgi:hypothetical protein